MEASKVVTLADNIPGPLIPLKDSRLTETDIRKLWEDKEIAPMLGSGYPTRIGYIAQSTGQWITASNYGHWAIPVDGVRKVVLTANANTASYYTFFSAYTPGTQTPATNYATGYTTTKSISAGTTKTIVVPPYATWMYLNTGNQGAALPASVLLTGTGVTEHRGTSEQFVKGDGTLDSNTYLTDSDVSDVATSGSYNDLDDQPTIPTLRTVNHEQLTDSSLGDINIYDGFYFPNAVQDYDGNWYGAVVVGDQVWLGENLRTTHYADGTAITKISGVNPAGAAETYKTTPYYYEISDVDEKLYGLLYNWPAVMNGASSSNLNPSGVQGIAPNGWHVPSESELLQLSGYLGKQTRFAIGGASNIAKAMATDRTSVWKQCNVADSPGNNVSLNNATGLNIVPAGRLWNNYDYKGEGAYLWSTKEYDNVTAILAGLSYERSGLAFSDGTHKGGGFSVRCICDLSPVQFRNWYVERYGSLQHHLPTPSNEILKYSMDVNISPLADGSVTTGVDGHPNILTEIDTARNASKTVLLDVTFGIAPSVTLFMPSSEIDPAYSFSGSVIYSGRMYFIYVTPAKEQNDDYIYGSSGGVQQLQWVVQVKSVSAQNILPSYTGNEGSVLSVNSSGNGVEWIVPFSGNYNDLANQPTNDDFGHLCGNSAVNNTSANIVVSLGTYKLKTGGMVSLMFANDVPANATLNINSKGARAIKYRGAAITAGVIKAGDRCLFMYNTTGQCYHLLSNDRWGVGV